MIRFVDTYALIALLNQRDGAHDSVRSYLANYSGTLITTEWVLIELADALVVGPARATVVKFLQAIGIDSAYVIIGYNPAIYEAGFKLFASSGDKGWSLTDCISFAVMKKRRQLTEALTSEKHFTQAGYSAVFA